MTMENNLSTLTRQLENLYDELRTQTNTRQLKNLDKMLLSLYDDICAAYLQAALEHRVDLRVAIESRDHFAHQLAEYLRTTANAAARIADKKRRIAEAQQLVQQGIAAQTIVERKVAPEQIEGAINSLQSSALLVGVDALGLAQELDIPAQAFVRRALQHRKGHSRIRALKALSLALQSNPKLEDDDRIAALAADLTGQSPYSALVTVGDGYVLKKLIENLEREQQAQQPDYRPRSTLDVIRSWFTQ
jgi:hypothetical protein